MGCQEHKDLNAKIWFVAIMLFFTVLISIINYTGGCSVAKKTERVAFRDPGVPPPPLSPEVQGFIALDRGEDAMVLDAQLLGNQTLRQNTRYIVGCDQFNQGVSTEDIEQGINKGINSLSTNRLIKKVRRIKDQTGANHPCIFAMDNRDYDISTSDWLLLERSLQLDFVTQTIRGQVLQSLIQTRKPYVFADDLMVTAFEADAVADKKCGIYCTIVGQPLDLASFFVAQGVNVQRQFDDEEALLSGFSTSKIALGKTRLVQIVESRDGYCMSTEDVSLAAQDSVFVNPFPKEAALAGGVVRSNRIYKFIAQEHICSLPNRMMALYRLNGNNGLAASFAPADIVGDPNFAKTDVTIRLGSCSACHSPDVAQGFKDQVKAAVTSNPGFKEQEKTLALVFFDDQKMQDRLKEINEINQETMSSLGITSSVDPINETLIRPMRVEQTAARVAAKVWISTDQFLDALRGTEKSSQALGNLLNGGTVSLGALKVAYPDLVRELNAYKDNNL